jgi:hypothetical protein
LAFQEQINARTYITNAAVGQFEFASALDANGRVGRAGAGALSTGAFLQAATAAGQSVAVVYDGRVQVIAAGAIAAGAAVMSNASGRAVTATATNRVLGYAVEAGVLNQVITVELARSERVA